MDLEIGQLPNEETNLNDSYSIITISEQQAVKDRTNEWLMHTVIEAQSLSAQLAVSDLAIFNQIHSNNEHSHWDWSNKILAKDPLYEFELFSLEIDGKSQALMLLKYPHKATLNQTQIVYVDYLQVAPWNLSHEYRPVKRYKGLGVLMLEFASEYKSKLEQDYGVGLGLHSLPQSEGFYNAIGCKDHGTDQAYLNLKYYEYKVA